MDLFRLTAHEAGDLLRRRETSSLELTRAALGRISSVDGKVRAFVTVCEEQALQQAKSGRRAPEERQRHAAHRRSGSDQGQHVHQRRAHYLQLQDAGDLRAALRCHGGGEAQVPREW